MLTTWSHKSYFFFDLLHCNTASKILCSEKQQNQVVTVRINLFYYKPRLKLHIPLKTHKIHYSNIHSTLWKIQFSDHICMKEPSGQNKYKNTQILSIDTIHNLYKNTPSFQIILLFHKFTQLASVPSFSFFSQIEINMIKSIERMN